MKFVTIDPSELHGFFKTKRAPQINMLDTIAVPLKETPVSLFIGDAARTGRQIWSARNFCQFNYVELSWMKQNGLKSSSRYLKGEEKISGVEKQTEKFSEP